MQRRLSAWLVSIPVLLLARGAWAHPVTVDGLATDWSARAANPAGARNVGAVVRTPQGTGEFVWDDATGDARTDLSGGAPEPQADITRVQVTGTSTHLMLLVQAGAPSSSGDPVQIMVSVDTNRTSGMGTIALPGFSSTDVGASAAWERVIRTRLRGAQPAIEVFNPTYQLVTPTGGVTPSIARGASGVIEMSVPWSMLGLDGVPAALRLTVAAYREAPNGDVVQISTAPHALDVMSNYGDPRATLYPNTFEEFNNPRTNTLDYFVDVFFAPTTGEVVAPMLITRVVPNSLGTTGTQWIELTPNTTATGLQSDAFKVGNATTIDGTLTTMRVPGVPFGTLRLAQNGANLLTRFGLTASAEWTMATPTVMDMTPYTLWSSGTNLSLASGGDVLLLLDGSDTVVDVVAWGTGAYTGVTAQATLPMTDQSLLRSGTTDTDNCMTDFTVTTPGGMDAGVDAGTMDAGTTDSGARDTGPPDQGLPDAGRPDVGIQDVPVMMDMGVADMGTPDTGTGTDAMTTMDAGMEDVFSPTDVTRRDVVSDVGAENPLIMPRGGCACTTLPTRERSRTAALAGLLGLLGAVCVVRRRRDSSR